MKKNCKTRLENLDQKNFDESNFKETLSGKNWFYDVNSSFNSKTFCDNYLNTSAPCKLLTKKQIKTKFKTWITAGMREGIN